MGVVQTDGDSMILLNKAVNEGVVILIEFYADGLPYAVTYKVERTEDSVHLDCIGTGDELNTYWVDICTMRLPFITEVDVLIRSEQDGKILDKSWLGSVNLSISPRNYHIDPELLTII
jgi:hypothetical protein